MTTPTPPAPPVPALASDKVTCAALRLLVEHAAPKAGGRATELAVAALAANLDDEHDIVEGGWRDSPYVTPWDTLEQELVFRGEWFPFFSRRYAIVVSVASRGMMQRWFYKMLPTRYTYQTAAGPLSYAIGLTRFRMRSIPHAELMALYGVTSRRDWNRVIRACRKQRFVHDAVAELAAAQCAARTSTSPP